MYMNRQVVIQIAILIILAMLLSGCAALNITGVAVDDSLFVRAVGIDKASDDSGNLRLTFISEKPTPAEGSPPESGDQSVDIYTAQGRTFFEAKRSVHAYTVKEPFMGHISLLIFGQDIANEDIIPFLDFFYRNEEFRFNASVLVAKGMTAEELIKKSTIAGEFLTDKIKSISKGADAQSNYKEITLNETLPMFADQTRGAYMPCVELVSISVKGDKDAAKMDLVVNGYALFEKGQLRRFITYDTARGVNWVNNDVKSGVIVVKDSTNQNVSLEIISAKSKIKPKLINGALSVEIEIVVQSRMGEQFSGINLIMSQETKQLEQEQCKQVEQEIRKTLDIVQTEGLDVFGIGNKVYHRYPNQWETMKENWKEIYQQTPITIQVKSKITGSYLFNQPIKNQ